MQRSIFTKVLSVTTAVVAIVSLAGCSGGSEKDPAASVAVTEGTSETAKLAHLVPEELRSEGTLLIASSFGRAPLEFFSEDNETVQGVDVDLAAAMGELLGLDLQMTDVRFPNIIPGLQSGKYAAAISGMQVTPERTKLVNMVSYVKDATIPLVRADQPEPAPGLCGSTVGAVTGATTADFVEEYSVECTDAGKPAVTLSAFPDTNSAVLALQSGRIDAVEMAESDARYVSSISEGKLTTFGEPHNQMIYGLATSLENEQLAEALLAAIQSLQEDGTYDEILSNWAAESMAYDSAAIE